MTAPYRGKRLSNAGFARLWGDLSLSTAQIGAMLGICGRSVTTRAQQRGLPPRKGGGQLRAKVAIADILPLWKANVSTDDIGRHFGMAGQTIRLRMARHGHKREKLRAGDCLPLADWLDRQLAARMAEAAAVTRAAMKDAEMVDRTAGRPRRAA